LAGRAILFVVVAIGTLPVASAEARTQHFFGHSTCGEGRALCPSQRHEFTASLRGHYLRDIYAPSSCEYVDGSGTDSTAVGPPSRIRVHRSGRFHSRGSHFSISGRVAAGRVTGRIDATTPASNPPYALACKTKGLRFRAHYVKRRLYHTGTYRGAASCPRHEIECPAQVRRITLRVRSGRAVSLSAHLACETDTHATKQVTFRIPRLRLDWYGRFDRATDHFGTTEIAQQATGAVRGNRVIGKLDYYEQGAIPGDEDYFCHTRPEFKASRRPPTGSRE
jgi:hypothetical protein